MSSIQRAAWAAQVPATGIVGIVPAANLSPTPLGAMDVGSLKAAGFAPGMVPLWNGSKFVPAPLPASSTTTGLTLTSQYPTITWTPATLMALESTEAAVLLPRATMSSLLFVVPLPGFDYLFFRARMTALGAATISVTNMSGDVVALLDGTYQVFIIT